MRQVEIEMVSSARQSGESGQALVEMVVGMVAMMCVFMGLLFVSAMGFQNIQNVISARQSVDENIDSNAESHAGVPISRWDVGDDKMFLTKDDVAVSGIDGSDALYTAEISMDKKEIGDISSLTSFDLKCLKACSAVNAVNVDNVSDQLSSSSFYVYAANLVSEESSNDDPLGNSHLGNDLVNSFSFITNGGKLSLSDKVFMPYIQNPSN